MTTTVLRFLGLGLFAVWGVLACVHIFLTDIDAAQAVAFQDVLPLAFASCILGVLLIALASAIDYRAKRAER
jgi:hypothetical protein